MSYPNRRTRRRVEPPAVDVPLAQPLKPARLLRAAHPAAIPRVRAKRAIRKHQPDEEQ
jgi:hypothetical protein